MSLPTRERGLKLSYNRFESQSSGSLPTRERGLKLANASQGAKAAVVAPYTGAWIETLLDILLYSVKVVAPYTGAWIETLPPITCLFGLVSLPTRERGLKLYCGR